MLHRGTNEWISIADMMAGVMMVFMLITVSYMVETVINNQELEEKTEKLENINLKMRTVAQNYEDLQAQIYVELIQEFQDDLGQWSAVIDQSDNTIRFKEPDVLFDAGKSRVKDEFKTILDDFFPRYIRILSQSKYRDDIAEIRIEGHTSEEWKSAESFDQRYLENVQLSQDRAYAVLRYCFGLNAIEEQKPWIIQLLRANGLSFAKPLDALEESRRVEFRTITRAKQNILEILDLSREL